MEGSQANPIDLTEDLDKQMFTTDNLPVFATHDVLPELERDRAEKIVEMLSKVEPTEEERRK